MGTKMLFATFGSAASTLQEGADATVYLATSPDMKEITDKYFDQKREARASPQAYDPEARNRPWWLSEELTGL